LNVNVASVVHERILSAIVNFFSAFTDGCHHAKEEDLLFSMLPDATSALAS
jgi:hemerythrin-like domain-containing protein